MCYIKKTKQEKEETQMKKNATVIKCERCLLGLQGAKCINNYNICGTDFIDISAFNSSAGGIY